MATSSFAKEPFTSAYAVRPILLQYIYFPSLADSDPEDFSPTDQKAMESKTHDLLVEVHDNGVFRIDQNPGNWVLERQKSKFVVIDLEDM